MSKKHLKLIILYAREKLIQIFINRTLDWLNLKVFLQLNFRDALRHSIRYFTSKPWTFIFVINLIKLWTIFLIYYNNKRKLMKKKLIINNSSLICCNAKCNNTNKINMLTSDWLRIFDKLYSTIIYITRRQIVHRLKFIRVRSSLR